MDENETVGINVLKRAQSVEISKQLLGYTGVRVFVGTDEEGNSLVYEAGDDSGNVLEIRNQLFASQEMAENVLEDIQGYRYQPLQAEKALLDPAAEMGDGVTVNGVYSGIFVRATQFGRLMASDIEAPTEEEIDHEFAVESPTDRQYTRFIMQTKAMLKITNDAITAEVAARTEADEEINATLSVQATEIAAKVSQTGGSNTTDSFSWSLTATGHAWYANGSSTPVFRIDKDGAYVNGEIRATKGAIGGFTIGSKAIYNNISSFGGTQTTGVYLGTDGIQLGQKFKVDTSGNVTASGITATSLKLKGTLTFLNSDGTSAGTMTAANLRQGALDGYNWGSGGGTYGGYSSKAAYSLGGAGNGFSAQKSWNNARDASVGAGTLYGTFVGGIQARSLKIATSEYGTFVSIGLWSGEIEGQQRQLVVWQ